VFPYELWEERSTRSGLDGPIVVGWVSLVLVQYLE
jgi:hypothetical protein